MNRLKISLTVIIAILALSLAACDATTAAGENAFMINPDSYGQTDLTATTGRDSSKLSDAANAAAGEAESHDGSRTGEQKFTGEVTVLSEDTISFNGETYTVETQEDLTTIFSAGSQYEIEYSLNEDGTIILVSAKMDDGMHTASDDSSDVYDDSNTSELEFKGQVEAVSTDTITMDGMIYTVVTDQDLTQLIAAGGMYEIEYTLNDDGTISIHDIQQEDDLNSGGSSSDDMNDDSSDDQYDDQYDDSNDDQYDDSSNDSSDDMNNNSSNDSSNDSQNDSSNDSSSDSQDDSSNDSSDDNNESNNDSENNDD